MNPGETKLNELSADGKTYGENQEAATRERQERKRRRDAVNRRVEESNEAMRRMMGGKK